MKAHVNVLCPRQVQIPLSHACFFWTAKGIRQVGFAISFRGTPQPWTSHYLPKGACFLTVQFVSQVLEMEAEQSDGCQGQNRKRTVIGNWIKTDLLPLYSNSIQNLKSTGQGFKITPHHIPKSWTGGTFLTQKADFKREARQWKNITLLGQSPCMRMLLFY